MNEPIVTFPESKVLKNAIYWIPRRKWYGDFLRECCPKVYVEAMKALKSFNEAKDE